MGEIPGPDDVDALDPCPAVVAVQVRFPARRPRIPGMHVQVSDELHYGDFAKATLISSLAPSSASPYFRSSWERYCRTIDWYSGSAAGLILTCLPIWRERSSSFFLSFGAYWRSTASTTRLRSATYSLKKPSSWLKIIPILRVS